MPEAPSTESAGSAAGPGRRRLIAVAAALVALLLVAGLVRHEERPPAKEYVTVAADIGSVAPAVVASGTVNPVTTIQVGSYVSGVIESLACDFNTRVHPGQLCAKIDPRPYQSAVDQEVANLANARAQLEKDRAALAYAKLIDERDAGLLKRDIVSQETVDTAANAYAQALSQIALDEATIQQHVASLQAARINLGYTNIVSPVEGTVVSRNVTQGQTVAASFQTPTLFLIATDLEKMEVDTNVSESDIGRIAEGNPASFTVESYPEQPFEGRVVQLRQAPQSVQNVITYDVVVGVANREHKLMPGMTASVRIVTARHERVLRVPDAALRYLPAGSALPPEAASAARGAGVWVLRDGRPQRVAVTVGLDDDAYAELLQGEVHAGDAVIVSEHAAAPAHAEPTPATARPPHL